MSDFVPVYKPGFVVEERGDLLRITTCMSQQEKGAARLGIVFLSLLAAGFLVSPVLAFAVHPLDRARTLFFGQYAYVIPLVMLLGFVIVLGIRRTLKHVMEITDTSIVILEGDYDFYRPRKYALAYVKNLRGSTYPGRKEGAVKFDYGARTVVFGKSLEEAEANLIVQAILKKFPGLKDSVS